MAWTSARWLGLTRRGPGMIDVAIRNSVEADHGSIIALNDAQVQQTSPMDRDRLQLLAGLSSYNKVALVDGAVAAFLLAMQHGAEYHNENFNWFAARFSRFLYVDRIVVGSRFAGLGIGRALYNDLFSYARLHGLGHVVCEYNIEPPNLASKAFHDKFGFKELDTQWVAGGTKQVSLQAAATWPFNPGEP